ncbi:hypothetical protein GGI35DRAFT_89733 [Trichoderma velutinum]
MQEQKIERGPRGRYARLICRGCRARKIKCILPSRADLGPLCSPQPKSTSCERCRNLDLECFIEQTHLGRPAAKDIIQPMLSSKPAGSASSRRQDEARYKLSNSIRQLLFSGAMNINWIESICEHTETLSNEDDLYYSMMCIKDFVALVLAKDASFGAGIHLRITCDTLLTDIVSHELAKSLDNLQTGLAKILYTRNSKSGHLKGSLTVKRPQCDQYGHQTTLWGALSYCVYSIGYIFSKRTSDREATTSRFILWSRLHFLPTDTP